MNDQIQLFFNKRKAFKALLYCWEYSNPYLQRPVCHVGFYLFCPIFKQLDRNFRIDLMKFSDDFRKKAGPYHWRQPDANMSLFQIAQIVQLSGQILKGSYN
ncbi:hypothetical protein D3C78_1241690 [compost metagenome]